MSCMMKDECKAAYTSRKFNNCLRTYNKYVKFITLVDDLDTKPFPCYSRHRTQAFLTRMKNRHHKSLYRTSLSVVKQNHP